jgi:hypothetical protein
MLFQNDMRQSMRERERINMDRQVLDETITYVKKELTRIHQDLTWADGSQAEAYKLRSARLAAELDRLESMRCLTPASPANAPAR